MASEGLGGRRGLGLSEFLGPHDKHDDEHIVGPEKSLLNKICWRFLTQSTVCSCENPSWSKASSRSGEGGAPSETPPRLLTPHYLFHCIGDKAFITRGDTQKAGV